ncbi:SAM-dependent methyltransferase [Streptomyces sp. DSM 44917]|uniref:SAM-dependent methyltransferase n=1 Tax=Streptomyces boetiae TaxID=3075541 RepID=A0ABU2L4V4_9ACTN|nr:SAM-dependent methyltransferase [Streptomyces sp. DSM 44917]MDT0306590.1 SAM-dependent methyltransferase [Streptomyces sp. DSM 44917]
MTDDAPTIDTSVPHSARIWNYWLGGRDHYEVDREAGERYRAVFPGIADVARASRAFMLRTVRYLAREAGIRQFLDIGTGLPDQESTHLAAQAIAPEARVVYVDNDPLVLAHARALLTSGPPGVTDYLDADLRDPEGLLAAAGRVLDFSEPVGLILSGVLGHVTDDAEARSVVARLLAALAPGSHLSLNDGSTAFSPAFGLAQRAYNESGATPYVLRAPERIAAFFAGLEPVPPGVLPVPHWRPETNGSGPSRGFEVIGGVGRKP